MLKRLAGSTLVALVTLCFAYSAITWGSMPGCTVSADEAFHHPAHGGSSHQHTTGSDQAPAPVQCFVHLCCVQLTTPTDYIGPVVRVALPKHTAAPVLVTQLIPIRPAHTLPFAHAPPTLG
jgi:hypothetical protein